MGSRRTLILIAAVAVGALAAFAIFNYVGGIEDRANEDARRVRVVKITDTIPQGLTGQEALDRGLLDLDAAIAQEFFPPNAILDVNTILTSVAVSDLAQNSVLVEGMFVQAQNTQITNARRIATGNVAITISVDDVRGVAGLIVPGDYVNMMAIPSSSICAGEPTAGEGAPEAPGGTVNPADLVVFCNPARMVYQGVRVLFVDRSPIPLPGEQVVNDDPNNPAAAANTGLLTLSVPPDAARVIASVGNDQWYLTLLPTDYDPAALPAFDPLTPTLPGEDPAVLTPYGPDGFQDDTP